MATPRILTFNFHEPYLCMMAATGLPFDIDWTDARMIFNLAITLLVVALLFGWEKRRTVFRFLSLGGNRSGNRLTRIINVILLLIALLVTPLLFAFPPGFQAETFSLDQLEEDLINRVNAAGSDVLRPRTKPSGEPLRDHLAFTKLPVMLLNTFLPGDFDATSNTMGYLPIIQHYS